MPFNPGIKMMIMLYDEAENEKKLSKIYVPNHQFPNLVLRYPGQLKRGDYQLRYHDVALSHTHIVEAVYNCAKKGHGKVITDFLVDFYKNGLKANTDFYAEIVVNNKSISSEEFKYLVYWIVLQEDINYSRPRKMGVCLPLIRYIEGAIAAMHPNLLTLSDVRKRTNVRWRRPDSAFQHDDLEDYLSYNIMQIV